MNKFDLPAQARRKTNRREIVLANITVPKAQADALALLYLRVLKPWTEAINGIVASYGQSLAGMTTDSPADTAGSIDSVHAAIQRLVLMLTPDLRDWALRVEDVHRGKWIRNVFSATSIDLATVLSLGDVADTVEAAINWNVALIRDVSDELRRRISNAVFSGFQARKPAREVAKEIREATGMARQRSLRIAADQAVKLGSRLNRARRTQAGIGHYKFRHSGKAHPRKHHEVRDGKVYANDDPRIPAGDRAGEPPFCGCTEQAVLFLADE